MASLKEKMSRLFVPSVWKSESFDNYLTDAIIRLKSMADSSGIKEEYSLLLRSFYNAKVEFEKINKKKGLYLPHYTNNYKDSISFRLLQRCALENDLLKNYHKVELLDDAPFHEFLFGDEECKDLVNFFKKRYDSLEITISDNNKVFYESETLLDSGNFTESLKKYLDYIENNLMAKKDLKILGSNVIKISGCFDESPYFKKILLDEKIRGKSFDKISAIKKSFEYFFEKVMSSLSNEDYELKIPSVIKRRIS